MARLPGEDPKLSQELGGDESDVGRKLHPQDLRHLRTDLPTLIQPGGWHFSYVGGPSRVEAKLAAYSHEENDRQEIALEFHDALRGGKDPFG